MLQPYTPTLAEWIRGERVIARCPETGAYLWKSRRQYGLIIPFEQEEAEAVNRIAPKHYIRGAGIDQKAIALGNRRLDAILKKRKANLST